ncbi:hypothetical protein QOZ84_11940 [Romboutsia sedimentorum]|uniref:Uncharacterized protein n=1 Tax=Romboutsia sedimentorum TaxID=1368474 RepID=A0ABT7EDV1_9FIRM|nr:hypothetical protein [Romboutsia sedimentorum]MDK2564263.1 hypothetical protein [Romboutsia sedimentorum]
MQAFKLKENDEINIDESRKHLTNLHKDSEGYITIASKNPNYSQWHYKKDDLLQRSDEIISNINTYVSQNTFYRPQRRIENGLTKREQDRLDKINAVKELSEKGYKQVQIVKELGLTKGRVSQIIKEIKAKKV